MTAAAPEQSVIAEGSPQAALTVPEYLLQRVLEEVESLRSPEAPFREIKEWLLGSLLGFLMLYRPGAEINPGTLAAIIARLGELCDQALPPTTDRIVVKAYKDLVIAWRIFLPHSPQVGHRRGGLSRDPGKDAIVAALVRTAGNETLAARLLSIHRTTLWRWMGKHKIDHEPFRPA